jgi:ABC-type Fe3+-siderophore transport system permease subunit
MTVIFNQKSNIKNQKSTGAGRRLPAALMSLTATLIISACVALWVGYAPISFASLRTDETTRVLFFQLRLPRVLMAGVVGASLAAVGAALQALFRNPLAEPLTQFAELIHPKAWRRNDE